MVDLASLSPSERARQLGKPEGKVGVEIDRISGKTRDQQENRDERGMDASAVGPTLWRKGASHGHLHTRN